MTRHEPRGVTGLWGLAITALAVTVAVVLTNCRPASEDTITVPARQQLGEHTIEEIETDRLVCAVAWSSYGRDVAISCVPNIPGLFEEPGQ